MHGMIKIFGTAVGICGKSNQGLEGRRLKVVSELSVVTGQGWTGRLMLSSHVRGDRQSCSSLLAKAPNFPGRKLESGTFIEMETLIPTRLGLDEAASDAPSPTLMNGFKHLQSMSR